MSDSSRKNALRIPSRKNARNSKSVSEIEIETNQGRKPLMVTSILNEMIKIFKRHGEKLVTIAVGAGLLYTLDWSWSNIKSFISGGVIMFYLWLIFGAEDK